MLTMVANQMMIPVSPLRNVSVSCEHNMLWNSVTGSRLNENIVREFGLLIVDQNNAMIHAFTEGLVTGLGKKTVQPLDGNVCTAASCGWFRLSSIGLCAEVRNVTQNLVVAENEDGSFSASLPPLLEAMLLMPSPGPSLGPVSAFNVSTPSVLISMAIPCIRDHRGLRFRTTGLSRGHQSGRHRDSSTVKIQTS